MAQSSARTEDVRCLQCGSVYVKPLGQSTARANPGCPFCEYVGWVVADRRVRSTALWRLPRGAETTLPPLAL